MNWIKRDWIILFVVVSFYGCATTGDVQILDKDIQRIDSQINQIQKEKDSIKNELAAFKKETKESKMDVSSLQMEVQRLQADLLLRIETLQSEIRTLSTSVEEYKEYLKKTSKEIDRMKEDVEVRLRILEEKGKNIEEKNRAYEEKNKAYEEKTKAHEDRMKRLEDQLKGLDGKIDKLASKQVEGEKPVPTKEAPADIRGISAGVGDLYKDAYEAFQKGDLDGARKKFEAFLKQYPNHELSDNAQFWIGETYYLKKDFEKAILEYEKAIAKYPEGDKIPAALLKQGLAFLELGDKANARNLFKRVVERYPQSEQAEIAKKKLETIK